MKKRLLSLFLAFAMVFSMLPATVLAGNGGDTGTVYISVSYNGKYVNDANGDPVAYVPVSLSDLQAIDLADYGLTAYDYNGQLTALHLYIYTHEQIMGENWADVNVQGGPGSIFFANGLFGFADCNLQYYCNGEYPAVDGWGVTADQMVLKDGDFVDVAAYTSWSFYSDSAFGYHYFLDGEEEITHAYTATADEALSITLGRGASFMGGEGSTITKVGDYTVSYGTELGTAAGTVTTDSNGEAEITFDEAGTYYLWVDGGYGAENPLDIVSAPGYAKVTVEADACAHETWQDATCTTPKTCADCGETEGEADPEAHSYVDGTCEHCGAAEPVATPSYTIKLSEAEELTAGLNYFISVPAEILGKDIIFDFGSGTIKGAMCQRHCSKRDIWTAGEGSTMIIAADKVSAHLCNESQRAKVASDFNLYLTEGSQMFAFYWWTSANMNGSYIYIEILPVEEECAHETWNPATCTTPKTCANCGETEGEADPEAHSYVNGTCEYCGAAKVEAVPFSQTIETPSNGSKVWGYVSSLELSGTDGSVKEYRWASESDPFVLNVVLGEDTDLDATITAKFAITYANDRYVPTLSGEDTVRLENGKGSITVTAVSGKPKSYPDTTWTVKLTVFDPNQTYDVTLPTNNVGFSVRATSSPTVTAGGEFSFKLNIYDDYKKGENFKVLANGVELTSSGDTYTITNITANQTVTVEGVVEKTLAEKNVTVNAPAGSVVSSGAFHSYFKYDFVEPLQISTLEDGRVQYIVPATSGAGGFIRVQNPDGVTYWDFGDLAIGKVFNITEEMLFIGNTEYTKDTVFANYEKNGHDTASLYLTVNAQGWLDMDTGDTHSLNVFRNWIPVSNSTTNTGVSLPDVTYTVVDVNGNASDVVTVTPDANNSCYADIKAVKAGTAIILVSYDAVYNADGEGGKQFSAIWPENTSVIVVTVDAEDANIQTNITVNEEANAGGKQVLDVEHDILFYVGDGAEYSFKPEDGCTVTVARSTVADEMSFNGFTAEGVTVAGDGTVTITGLTTGAHIIKVEKDGKVAYQGIRAREVKYKLTHSDGTEVTAENPAQPGETITVQFSKLIDPMGKLSGVYNAKYGFRYTGENGDVITITSTSAYGEYYFGSNPARQRFAVTVPTEWSNMTYTFTDGSLKLEGWGSTFGGHRSTTYMEGKEPNTNASGTAGYAAVLPDVVIPVDVEPEVDTTLSTYIFNSDIDGTGWGRADAAYADKLSLFGAGVDALRWDGDTCYVTLDKKTESNAGLGFLITYKAQMDSWLDGLKATVNGESMTANEMLFTKLTNGTLTAEVYVTNNDIPSQSGTKTFVITVADETACDHEWTEANCTVPKTCKLCGVTRGDVVADGHNYVDGKCEYCGNYVGLDIVTDDTASGNQDIRISNFYINAYGTVLSNTIAEDGRATVQLEAPLDELELTISMFGKKGMVLSKAALAINDGDAVVPTSVDKDNNVAVWIGTVTPEWNGNKAEIKVTVGFTSSSGFKSPKDYILTLEKVEETPEPTTYTVTLPSGTGYTVTAGEGSTSPVTEGGSYSFTVTIADGYEAGETFAVKANDVVLTAVEGVYTIENITADRTVTVEGVVEKQEEPALTWQEVMAKTQAYLTAQAEDKAPIVSSTGGEWLVLGLVRNGVSADSSFFNTYFETAKQYIKENIDENGRLHAQKSTDNSRLILALTALGKDVTNVGGYDLIKGLTDGDYVKKQGINGAVFALIALDSNDYAIPTNADSSKQVTREWLVEYILGKQLDNGGWALSGQTPDDMTPMTIQALAPYYSSNADVETAVDKALAVMETMSATPETYAQMIVALSALGIDCETDDRFADVMDNMLTFALEDGSFQKSLTSGVNQMSTEQCFYALVAYNRFKNDQTPLYDMTDVELEQPEQTVTVEVVKAAMEALKVEKANKKTYAAMQAVLEDYAKLTREEKALIADTYEDFLNKEEDFEDLLKDAIDDAKLDLEDLYEDLDSDEYTEDNWDEIRALYRDIRDQMKKASCTEELQALLATFEEEVDCILVGAMEVTFRLIGDFKHDDGVSDHEEYVTWIKTTGYTLPAESTVYDLLIMALEEYDLSQKGASRNYVESIKAPDILGGYWLGEFDNGQNSGWMYTINGDHPGLGLKEQELEDGDEVIWHYVDDYTLEERKPSSKYYERWLEADDITPETYVKRNLDNIVTVEGEGEVKPALKASHIGKDVKFTITPAEGWFIQSVCVDGKDKGAIETYTYKDLAMDARIEVVFARNSVYQMNFVDVPTYEWFYDDVYFAVSNGLFNGVAEDTFSPGTSMTRAMLVTVLYRLESQPAVSGSSAFDDVAADQWYTDAVVWATGNGIINGLGNGKFGTDDPVTREQMAVILYRYAENCGYDTTARANLSGYTDAANISAYAQEAMSWANAMGLVNGRTATSLAPTGTATRAEVAAIFHRFVENIAK